MTDRSALFEPLQLGDLSLPNRVLMAPLTRNRARPDGVPGDSAARYYHQRASAGLIISEATNISAIGTGYIGTPGIYTDAHVAGWAEVTRAVRAGGGRIVCQLWHVGRISHQSLLPEGRRPVSSSAVRANARCMTKDGRTPCSEPEALTLEGIRQTVADYRYAAECARRAGFDGVELHSANGYLLDQFLQDGVNRRTDAYGGSVDHRTRLLGEVVDALCEVWPAGRVGVRLAPLGQAFDISDSDPEATFGAAYDRLSGRGLAYLHAVEQFPGSERSQEDTALLARLRRRFDGGYLGNGAYDGHGAAEAIRAGQVDAVAFGRSFLANPDLPERLRVGAALNEPDSSTFYGGGDAGYVDYPFLER